VKAAQYAKFGGPDVLTVGHAPDPVPLAGQVLVRVAATSINAEDTQSRAGALRAITGGKFPKGTAHDIAGTVEALGDDVRSFDAGERVWGVQAGFFSKTSGAAAEFIAIDASLLARVPTALDLQAAAALPAVGITAVRAITDVARVQPGERVLVRGGAGGVGSVAIQYAHSIGAHVTTLVSEHHVDFAIELGADIALDRAKVPHEQLGVFDVIIDTAGSALRMIRRHLSARGRMVAVAFDSAKSLAYIAFSAVHGRRRIRTFLGPPKPGAIERLTTIVEAGEIQPVVHAVYPLSRIAHAHRQFEQGGLRGKIVIGVATEQPLRGSISAVIGR